MDLTPKLTHWNHQHYWFICWSNVTFQRSDACGYCSERFHLTSDWSDSKRPWPIWTVTFLLSQPHHRDVMTVQGRDTRLPLLRIQPRATESFTGRPCCRGAFGHPCVSATLMRTSRRLQGIVHLKITKRVIIYPHVHALSLNTWVKDVKGFSSIKRIKVQYSF